MNEFNRKKNLCHSAQKFFDDAECLLDQSTGSWFSTKSVEEEV